MTIIQEMWHFAVSQGKQFMDCVIFSEKGEQLFTNSCFLKLQKGFVNMNFDKEDNFITVIMNDHSEVEIQKLLNGFVATEYQLTSNSYAYENESKELKDTSSKSAQSQDMVPGLVEIKEITKKGAKTGTKSFFCHFCGKEFLNSVKLKVHKYQVHKPNNEAFKCTICCKIMKTKSILYKHMFIHSDPRFSCNHCSRVWIVKSQNLIFISKLNLISFSLEFNLI